MDKINIDFGIDPPDEDIRHLTYLQSFIKSPVGRSYYGYLNNPDASWNTMGLRLRVPVPYNFQMVEEVPLGKNTAFNSIKTYYKQAQSQKPDQVLKRILQPYRVRVAAGNNVFRYDFNQFIDDTGGDKLKQQLADTINTLIIENTPQDKQGQPATSDQQKIDAAIRQLNKSFNTTLKPQLEQVIKKHIKINACQQKLKIKQSSLTGKKTNISFIQPIFYKTIVYYLFWFFLAINCATNSRYIWNMIVQNAGKSDDDFKKVTGGISRKFYVVVYYTLLVIVLIIFIAFFLCCFELFRNKFKFKTQDITYTNIPRNPKIKLKNMNMYMDFINRGAVDIKHVVDAGIATTIAAVANTAARNGDDADAVRDATRDAFIDTVRDVTGNANLDLGNAVDRNFIQRLYPNATATVNTAAGVVDGKAVATAISAAAENAENQVWQNGANSWSIFFKHFFLDAAAIWILVFVFFSQLSVQSILITHRASRNPDIQANKFRAHTLIGCGVLSIILVILIIGMIYTYHRITRLNYFQLLQCGRGY